MFRKILLYGLPLYLYSLELLLKRVANVNSDSLAGPTLAGAGIGFLLPLTDLKRLALDPYLAAALATKNADAYSPKDKTFTDLVWVAFFLSLGAWMYSIYLTLRPPLHSTINGPLAIGGTIFVVSIAMAELKERI